MNLKIKKLVGAYSCTPLLKSPSISVSNWIFLGVIVLLITACSATAEQVIPTQRPTETATFTPSATNTPGRNATPTVRPTQRADATGGPSPTPLLGPTRTLAPNEPTATRVFNPNAARIEFFTSDVLSVAPGGEVTLYWSVRGVDSAVIYRIDADGSRSQVWNVPPDSSLPIRISSQDRGDLNFLLTVGEEDTYNEMALSLPIQCPIVWFFIPAPNDCPATEAEPSQITEQIFERGRALYIESRDIVYVLFNDGAEPTWLAFNNAFDPEIHPESEENFIPPPGFFQPLRQIGFLWRGNDTVRNRLGLGIEEANVFDGLLQTAPARQDREDLYVSSADTTVLHIVPGGTVWEVIAP